MPLGDVPGVRLISLQKDDGGPAAESGGWIETLDPALNSGPDAFLDTAAVMMGLDLIVACGSAAAHLAGALGRPVWIALPFVPHCRWMMDCGDSPWYPTARPFRQPVPGEWSAAFAEIVAALGGLARRPDQ